MKKTILKYYQIALKSFSVLLITFLIISGCSEIPVDQPKEDANLNNSQQLNLPPGGGILMQAFYWDVPAGGNWWNTVKSKIPAWKNAGITAVWLPPASKAQNGGYSMGYDPMDYYDFGSYNQMGSTETRFGSTSELTSLITTIHNNGLQVYADIVINHNSGGASEYNEFTGGNTWTKFNPASGKFPRSKYDFHPNDYHSSDAGSFGGFPDLCHNKSYVQDWLWKRTDAVSKYYKNTMKFDGWRFDYVKGFDPWVVKDWNYYTGGFSVGEYWDSNVGTLNWWCGQANSSAFDFALYYALDNALDNNNMYALDGAGLAAVNSYRAVTFVSNHDTDIIWKKMLAYAFILTMEGYPTIFYRDYEEWLPKDRLNNLMWIHANKAVGSTSKLFIDNDEFILQRNGAPGLVLYLNNSGSTQTRWVQTKYRNVNLHDFTGQSSKPDSWADGNGWVQISAPANSYAVYSIY